MEGWVVQVAAIHGKDSDLLQCVFTVDLKIKFSDNHNMIVSTSLKSEAVRTALRKYLKLTSPQILNSSHNHGMQSSHDLFKT